MAYPNTIDNFTDPTAVDNLDSAAVLHDIQHKNVNDAIFAIETELGTNPRGAAVDVKTRLTNIEAALAAKSLAADEGAANGIATLDAGSMLVQNVDGGKITTGSVPVARIPNLSGAKILGTGGGGAAIPVDAVPNIPASKTNSGVLAVAQIPNLPASQITSGTIDPARIPTTVTSNANATVVADIAARNAIPIGNRINGQLVFIESTKELYEWSTNTSTWNLVSAAVDVQIDVSTWLAANVIAYDAVNYPVRGWYNTANKRFTLELVLKRTVNSASLTIHSAGVINAAYLSDKYVTGVVPTLIGGAPEKMARLTITMGAANSIDVVLTGGAAIWSTTQYIMVNASWRVTV